MDEQQKRVFAERLERIQAQKADPVPAPEMPEIVQGLNELPPLPPVNPPGGNGGGFGPIRTLLILVILLAMGGFGAFYASEMSDGALDLTDVQSVTPIETPAQAVQEPPNPLLAFAVDRPEARSPGQRTATDRGWEHTLGSVATPDGAQVQVADIASGFDPSRLDSRPARIETFQPNENCTLRRPRDGEVVRNVRLGAGTGFTEVHAVSDAGIADAILTHSQAALFSPKSHEFGRTAKGRMNRVDVFVTDTSGPVYLVLQALSGNTLWNVHRGQGVQIAHIAMIGNTSGIIAPNGVAFEALRIADFGINFDFEAHDVAQPCMIAPYRLPKDFWEGQKKAAKGNALFENQMFTFNSGHRAFSAWYTEVLGVDPETGLTEAEGAAHALVGPVPPGLLGFRPLAGQTIHVTEAERLLIGDDALIEAHQALMIAAAGGDVAAIQPETRRVQR
ncbi:MAG: hypothetical protein AAF718_02690 [Pseudomonadota bacterium]